MYMRKPLKFWTRAAAQRHADELNKTPKGDAASEWKLSPKRIKYRYLLLKEYYGNLSGTYTEVATH